MTDKWRWYMGNLLEWCVNTTLDLHRTSGYGMKNLFMTLDLHRTSGYGMKLSLPYGIGRCQDSLTLRPHDADAFFITLFIS